MSGSGSIEAGAVITEQSGKAAEPDSKGARQIRTRSSYLLFRQLYDFLKTNPDMAEILRKFYEILDAKGGFGSRRNAEYAAESLDMVFRENAKVNEGMRR